MSKENPTKLLFLDIETAPGKAYVWQLKQDYINPDNVVEHGYTLCWAAKWHGRSEVMFGSVHRHGVKAMVRSIHKLLDEADAVAHYNGRKFDIPVLNKEFLLHNLPPPAPFKHIDLLQVCKRQFQFFSNKLDFVSQALGIGAKVQHKGMELWKGCMAGDEASWRVMENYNKGDVRLTERLYERLKPWIPNHPNMAVYGGEKRCCPNCGSTKLQSRGEQVTTTLVYRRLQCRSCGKWSRERRPKDYQRPALVAA